GRHRGAEAEARADREAGGQRPATASREDTRGARESARAAYAGQRRPGGDRGAPRRASPARRAGVPAPCAIPCRRGRSTHSRAAQGARRARGETPSRLGTWLSSVSARLRRNSATHTVHTVREPDGGFEEAWPSAFY